MSSHAGIDYHNSNVDYKADDIEDSDHKKDIRRKLDMKLDRKRLKEELEDYEGEIDYDFEWEDN